MGTEQSKIKSPIEAYGENKSEALKNLQMLLLYKFEATLDRDPESGHHFLSSPDGVWWVCYEYKTRFWKIPFQPAYVGQQEYISKRIRVYKASLQKVKIS